MDDKLSTSCAIIVAGGKGLRSGLDYPKQLFKINNQEIIVLTLEKFQNSEINKIIIVSEAKTIKQISKIAEAYDKVKEVVFGGETRQESVKNGLDAVKESEIVLIHDALRPFVSIGLINRCISQAKEFGSCIPVLHISDTLKKINEAGFVTETVDRDNTVRVQTPQAFKTAIIKTLYSDLGNKTFTDDASVLELSNIPVKTIEGEYFNIKLTTPADFENATKLLLLLKTNK